MRLVAVLSVAALLLTGCGGEPLTNERVRGMGNEEALEMLDCQMRKAAEDLGQDEAVDRYAEDLIGSEGEGGDLIQVILWNDGYRCPEYLT